MSNSVYSLGLIGYPLQHSLSPRLHVAALERMGLPGEYRLYPIPPTPEGEKLLGETLGLVRSGQILGLNVTIPHKQAVLPYLDHLTAQARAIGAVNTIFCRSGLLTGDNTDAPGFISDLQRLLVRINRSSEIVNNSRQQRIALVLGAGGAARAIVYALWQAGWQVTVAARRPEQAVGLVTSLHQSSADPTFDFSYPTAVPLEISRLNRFISSHRNHTSEIVIHESRLIVNATSAGMLPDVLSCPWPEELTLPEGWLVYDLVYKPSETVLMRRARAAGLPVMNGLGMLIEQAALALERWTGQPVPRQAMWEVAGQSMERGIL
jgi:shikimate dehydrogenase